MTDNINKQLALICGVSGSGKSASLRNIRNQEKKFFLNCEAGKRLPFKNNFRDFTITEPYQVYEAFDYAKSNPNECDGIIIDTSTFLMDMFESMYVINASNTQKAWGDYFQYWKNLMQDKVANAGIPVLILAHVKDELDEKAMEIKTSVPVKGALKNNGIEAYFSTVVSTKKISLTELEKYKSDLIHLTDDDKDLGFKYVFQTRPTKQTLGERIRSPMGMFSREQTYMDNDAQLLLDHLDQYYA